MTDDNIRQIWSDAELDAALAELHDDVDDGDLTFARTSLLAAAGADPEAPSEPAKSRGAWRWIAVAAAVAALTGGLVVVTQLTNRDPASVGPAAPAGPPGLDDLRGADLAIRPGEFRHTTMSEWFTMNSEHRPEAYVGTQSEVWIPADPTATWRFHSLMTNTLSGLQVPSPQYEPPPLHESEQTGPGGLYQNVQTQYAGQNFRGSWDNPTAPFITGLPADVEQLRARLLNDESAMSTAPHPGLPNGPSLTIQMVRQVLELGLIRGEVRVALWRALAGVPGIVITPGKPSPDGRIGVGFTASDTGSTLIADPATAQLIGYTLPSKGSVGGSGIVQSTVLQPPSSTMANMPRSPDSPMMTTRLPPHSTVEQPNSLEQSYTYSITKTDR
jgi:hypothetical protein